MAMHQAAHWEHFEHVADMGVRGFGPTPAEAFSQAALAMTATICEPDSINPRTAVPFELEDDDLDYLLLDWLNALVYEMATRRMLFGRFEVAIEDGQLRATAWGEPVDVARHQPAVEVKGATLTELSVQQIGDQWVAQCVIDV
ncbi:MAG: archease [Halothiobacillaceae bacterium]|nr:MAG: archease [Halothiobacillaceae bacterium]